MKKVDVIINIYGKPWQTICTLKSLMSVSGEHIDKIYFIIEKQQPYDENINMVLDSFDNKIVYTPQEYVFIKRTDSNMISTDNRYGFRYQYGIENSDKKHVFITHNDILYTKDIIGNMLNEVDDCAGIGLIGQCWNCPAFNGGACNSDMYNDYKPSYIDVLNLIEKYPPARGQQHNDLISKSQPMPLPECRLNEFACLINTKITNTECYPYGNSPLFGSYDLIDLGSAWFKSLTMKGYKFKNYNIGNDSSHCYFANNAGYMVQLYKELYIKSELTAKKYYEENFNNNIQL